jgi:hypothetical protein
LVYITKPIILMEASNKPLGLSLLDTKIIKWDIPKNEICLLEMFGSISYGLVVILRSNIQVHKYHYVEREPQTKQVYMCHTMMLQNIIPTCYQH